MPRAAPRPHVIVLVLDAVRAKAISAYGSGQAKTPCLDSFAAENALFRRAFAPATWTIPTHTSMLTGLYLSQHRIESTKADRYLNPRIATLPKVLQGHGYRAAAFSQNHLFSPKYFASAFPEFYQMEDLWRGKPWLSRLLSASLKSNDWQSPQLIRYWRKLTGLRHFMNGMLQWIEALDEEAPFFLMANIANAHHPWAPPPDLIWRGLGRRLGLLRNSEMVAPRPFQFNSGKRPVTDTHRQVWRALYMAAILHIDREFGRFLRRLRRWRGWQNTIVVVTADHGEMLGEHQDVFSHMLSLHDNLLHVPLIVRHPDYPRGCIVERVVQNLDLFSSVVEWTGCSTGSIAGAQLQRPGLSASLEAPAASGGLAFAEEDYTDSYNPIRGLLRVNAAMDPGKYPQRQVCVHTMTHKYLWANDRPGELYDLRSDPQEVFNTAGEKAPAGQAVLHKLEQTLDNWRARLEYFSPVSQDSSAEVDTVTLERLRNLGYVE